jgi:hypothetical protein
MSTIFFATRFSKKSTIFQIFFISSAIFASQSIVSPPKAEANVITEAVLDVSIGTAIKYGFDACGVFCAIGAAASVHVINNSIPSMIATATEFKNSGLKNMFYFWGATYLTP